MWDRVKKLVKRWTGKSEYAGPTRSEDDVVKAFAEDFVEKVMWPMSSEIVNQLISAGKRAGLRSEHLPYLFSVWNGGAGGWPRVARDVKEWLQWSSRFVISQGDMPNYQGIPGEMLDSEEEWRIDQAIQEFGTWLASKGHAALLRGYWDKLKKWAREMHRARPSLPGDKAWMYLQALFQNYLKRAPGMFLDGYYLEPLVKLLI
jgi:hypothetical protein